MTGEKFFTLPDGREAKLFKLRQPDGSGADITNFGGCLVSLFIPDAAGNLRDVVLGWDKPEKYLDNFCNFGAIIGRVPNRISGGKFVLDGRVYQMILNDRNISTLHGGFSFAHRLWEVESATDKELILTLFSPHGDAGFPGNLFVRASYRFTCGHTLEVEITAESDRLTVADFTTHAYFNLDGEDHLSTSDHFIRIAADRFTEIDANLLPTGKVQNVSGTIMDLRRGMTMGEFLMLKPGGADDNFVIGENDRIFRKNAAYAIAGHSGITMAVHTNRPGIQFYMAGCLDQTVGKSIYPPYSGFCLETQCWPDAVNHDNFPDIFVKPGKPHHSITRFEFDTVK